MMVDFEHVTVLILGFEDLLNRLKLGSLLREGK